MTAFSGFVPFVHIVAAVFSVVELGLTAYGKCLESLRPGHGRCPEYLRGSELETANHMPPTRTSSLRQNRRALLLSFA